MEKKGDRNTCYYRRFKVTQCWHKKELAFWRWLCWPWSHLEVFYKQWVLFLKCKPQCDLGHAQLFFSVHTKLLQVANWYGTYFFFLRHCSKDKYWPTCIVLKINSASTLLKEQMCFSLISHIESRTFNVAAPLLRCTELQSQTCMLKNPIQAQT